jgi:hypothetical protein
VEAKRDIGDILIGQPNIIEDSNVQMKFIMNDGFLKGQAEWVNIYLNKLRTEYGKIGLKLNPRISKLL